MHSGTFIGAVAAAIVASATAGGALAADAVVPGAGVYPAPSPAIVPAAHAWDLLFGVTATSQYISRGLAQTDGPAIQPWAELDVGPFYLGYWGSNTDPALTPGSFENDLSVGVRLTPGPLSLDFGFVRYVYDTGDCCGELYAKASVTPIEQLTLGAAVFVNPDTSATYVEGNGKLLLTPQLFTSGAIGSQDGTISWNAGLSFALNDAITLDGRWYAGPTADKFVVSIAFATAWSKLNVRPF